MSDIILYDEFIKRKASEDVESGFEPSELGAHLFDFQSAIVEWACKRGRAAIFADTGLGKTAMQTEWAKQVCIYTGGDVLIAAPLCVAQQTVEEAAKFGISIKYARSQADAQPGITITNYEMLDKFNPADFAGIVLDESSILKSHTSKTRAQIIEMFQATPYRLSCTATPSPNDHMELGNQAEFLGVMTAVEMLAMFFVHDGGDTSQWRLKGHGKTRFWEWMSTWAICIRNPADLGFDGSRYILPGLDMHEHVVEATEPLDGQLFAGIAQTLTERRDAKRKSMAERVQITYDIVSLRFSDKQANSTTKGFDHVEAGVRSEAQGKVSVGRDGEGKEAGPICPLQLDVIERAMELWSNPGDLVFSPFTGIGSEGYVSIEMGRKFVGSELKRSYWELAKRNLNDAREHQASGLFAMEELETA